MSTIILGVAGGIGSGKTTVTDYLKQKFKIPIIDADEESRKVVEPGSPALNSISEYFGKEVLQEDGSLNRPLLRQLIFDHPEKKAWLEDLLHPVINQQIQHKLKLEYDSPYIVLVSPLLFESNQHHLVDLNVTIDSNKQNQIERVKKRDQSTVSTIENIMKSQLSREERNQQSDFIISNNGSLEDLYLEIETVHQQILERLTQFD